jgi:uncharacterized protein YecE (DUF72 family)
MSIVKYHIGTTQWGLKEWVGNFFTENASSDQFLRQYSTVFNTVEGNTTFYRVPDPEIIKRWGDAVPDGFKFCFKIPQSITHYRRLKDVYDETMQFIELFDTIREHLGPFHIQLSSQFSYNEFSKLDELLNNLPRDYAYALEVRHPDFYDKGKKESHLNHLLKNLNIDRVVFDTRRLHALKSDDPSRKKAQQKKPQIPVRFDPTGSRPFVRFVGANDVLNNEAYLKEWAIVTADWIREGFHPYIFIHAPDTLHAPKLARYFHNELSKLIELMPMPRWPAERQDEQLGLF